MKKSTLKTWLAVTIVALISIGIIGFASSGFSNWDRDSWRDRFIRPGTSDTSTSSESPIDSEDISEDSSEDVTSEEPEDPFAQYNPLYQYSFDLTGEYDENDFEWDEDYGYFNLKIHNDIGDQLFLIGCDNPVTSFPVVDENEMFHIVAIDLFNNIPDYTLDYWNNHKLLLILNNGDVIDDFVWDEESTVLCTSHYGITDFSIINFLVVENYPEHDYRFSYDLANLNVNDFTYEELNTYKRYLDENNLLEMKIDLEQTEEFSFPNLLSTQTLYLIFNINFFTEIQDFFNLNDFSLNYDFVFYFTHNEVQSDGIINNIETESNLIFTFNVDSQNLSVARIDILLVNKA